MVKPIALSLPYPTGEGVEKNLLTASKLSILYAGKHGELNATLQYVYQSFFFNKFKEDEIASTLMGIAVAEMEHLEILGELILELGQSPVYAECLPYRCNFYSSSNVSYCTNAEKMLLDDIAGEMLAVSDYEKAISDIDDEKVQAILLRIKLDEELHIKVLKDALSKVSKKS